MSKLGAGTESVAAQRIQARNVVWESDSWQLDQDLATAEELVRQVKGHRSPGRSEPGQTFRIDPPHFPFRRQDKAAPEKPKPAVAGVAWALLGLGVMGSACGGALLVWCWVGRRPDLLMPGAAFTVTGQGVLILGLLLQLDRLWSRSHETNDTLRHLDRQIDRLHRRSRTSADESMADSL